MKLMNLLRYLTASIMFFSVQSFAGERIVSIGGDVTEIIYALNAEQSLVGRDSTSLIPTQVQKLPDIGYMRQLNAEGILSLKPTKVMASEVAQPAVVFEQLKSVGIQVDILPFGYTAESVIEKIKRIGKSLNKSAQAEILSKTFVQQLEAIDRSDLDVRILFVLNRAGANQMVAGSGTMADTEIKLIGAKNAMENQVRFTPISQEGVIAANPDLIVMTQLGIKALGGEDKVWELAGILHTNAGKQRNLVVVEDIALMSFGLTTPKEMAKLRMAAEKVKK
ncbi:hemin ABC transporter substrate-binding protein [Conservatibacter flavescens]|uniref:Hemin ABC transporter substrate-binding protein n=2 Tax=Conservatibacter flavescens TaxID=28161 RepID=A0A2M8S244_9PAST|nr:hemin ABC transporter substrate-binding protein [Conservatibacter flavescens]PJG85229.1 hemin ABC transporter substrate-binding protein [Conservatibacter flavescens]